MKLKYNPIRFLRKVFFPATKPDEVISKAHIKSILPAKPIVFEAGAHIGVDTLEMSRLWPDATIYAFEPVPHIFKKLQRNTRNCKNVKCIPVALGDKNGKLPMFVSSGRSDGSSSLLKPKYHLEEHPDVLFEETIEVDVFTIDSWCEKNNISKVDFMWLDMQGFEMSTLKASPNILKNITAIHSEVNTKPNYENTALYPEFKNWMESVGFRVDIEDIPWNSGGNVLFVRK